MSAYVRVTTAVLVPLMALGGGCASVGTAATPKKASSPSSTTAPAAARAHIVQAAWPGEAVRVVKGGLVMLDAFEGLLAHAGLDILDQLPPRDRPLDRESAMRLLAVLLDKPLPLRNFPQRMGACFLLREVLENGPASRDEVNRRVDRFRQVVVLRPDGYLAWVLSGHTQQSAGQVEFKDGVFKANGFVLGQFYSGRRGAYFPVDAQMEPLRDSTILGEVYDDGDLFGRAMDGAEEAFFSLAMAVGKFLSRPLDGIAGLRTLPAGVAALIASSPEYLERFELMTAGEQIQAVSRLTATLITMLAGGSAVSAGLTRGLGGMEVTGLSLSAQGTLALGRVVFPAGGVATVLAAGAGAPIVLQSTAAASQSAAVDGVKSGSADPAQAAGGIRFAQRGISAKFGHGEFAGKTLQEVAAGLRSGAISANQLPIQTITREGITYTLNNRSLMALRQAGLEPTIVRDVTGNAFFEAQLTQRLAELGGSVPPEFLPIIRGGP